jgi:glycosyltransferase involved in cell wall biosynthesis
VRREFEIGETDSLLLYLGRLNRDKGLLDLTRAFVEVANCQPDTHLLLVGPDEGGIRGEIASLSQAFRDRVHFKDFTDAPERYMAAADLFCLPSYREGFGSVIIEAAACGVPAVASRIYGITDAVINGQTGVLHPKGDVAALRNALLLLLSDPDLRETMGRNAALRATAEFDQEIVTAAMVNFFDQIAAI